MDLTTSIDYLGKEANGNNVNHSTYNYVDWKDKFKCSQSWSTRLSGVSFFVRA
jgi:hypothetical protein